MQESVIPFDTYFFIFPVVDVPFQFVFTKTPIENFDWIQFYFLGRIIKTTDNCDFSQNYDKL